MLEPVEREAPRILAYSVDWLKVPVWSRLMDHEARSTLATLLRLGFNSTTVSMIKISFKTTYLYKLHSSMKNIDLCHLLFLTLVVRDSRVYLLRQSIE